jgi:hypothetical protein
MELKEVYFRNVAISPLPLNLVLEKDFRSEKPEIDYRSGYVAHLLKIIQLFEPNLQIDFSELVWEESRVPYGYFDYYLNDVTLNYTLTNGVVVSAYGQSGFHYESDGKDYLGITIYLAEGRFVHCTVENDSPLLQIKLSEDEVKLVTRLIKNDI